MILVETSAHSMSSLLQDSFLFNEEKPKFQTETEMRKANKTSATETYNIINNCCA